MESVKAGKILIIKLCCMGDIVQTTPAMRAFYEAGLEVHLLCSKWVKDIAGMVPFIHKIHIIDSGNPASIIAAILGLRYEKFDIVVNFHRDMKSYIFTALTGARLKAGFEWKGSGRMVDRVFPFDPAQHETQRYLSVARGLGYASEKEYTRLSATRAPLPGGEGKLRIGIFPAGGSNPGTVMPTKIWPAEKFNALIRMFEEKNAAVYVFGSPADRAAVEKAAGGTGARIMITSNIREFASYASGLGAFVASDTGPLHIAAALGVPTVGLFGPTSPEHFGARGENSVNLWEKQACPDSPCCEPLTFHKRKFLGCGDNICMKAITPEKVYDTVMASIKTL
jgi:ADP-heptose:LPS heptosyltransferase